jgi:predicted GTPase
LSAVTLSLISHTNAGKTTLARTLLRRDVGEVRFGAHVTLQNTPYDLLETDDAKLVLWDTPGFGDSARLLKRLKRMDRPLVWFFSQLWDRFTDKPLWCSQQALRNVREEAEVVLYLVNASESLAGGAFVEAEMEILGWLGKPVVVLLNQTGPPRPADDEAAEEKLWRQHLSKFPVVREVLNMDAFSRCWKQEGALMHAIARVLPDDKREPFKKLEKAWAARNEDMFRRSMRALALQLTANALDGVPVKPLGFLEKSLRSVADALHVPMAEADAERATARQKLCESLSSRLEQTLNQLITLHGLEGDAGRDLLNAAQADFSEPQKMDVAATSLMSGAVSGGLAGLIADLKAGGLTFGGGALVGAVIGVFGSYRLIKAFNLDRGEDNKLHWSREHFREQVKLWLLSYLAVAHFGRGRGAWRRDPRPAHWQQTVSTLVDSSKDKVDSVWKHASRANVGVASVNEEMETLMRDLGTETLRRLYPQHS